jgi:hypothetical protein
VHICPCQCWWQGLIWQWLSWYMTMVMGWSWVVGSNFATHTHALLHHVDPYLLFPGQHTSCNQLHEGKLEWLVEICKTNTQAAII